MSTSRRFLLVAAAAGLVATQAQAWGWGSGERVKGDGNVVTESRDVGSFDGVSMTGGFDVVVRPGPAVKIEVRADKNLMPYLETKLVEGSKGRTLEIGPKRGFDPVGSVTPTLTIELPSLRAVAVAGSGKIKVEPMKTSAVDASIAGSGDILISGIEAEKLSMRVSGSGDIVASGRSANAVVSIAGSGDVRYAGSPEISSSVAGSGSVKRIKD